MSKKIMLNATKREDLGKGASRRLRRSGFVPAVIYGGKETPTSITLEQRELQKEMKNENFYSQILTVTLDGSPEPFILKDLQRHPYKPMIVHLDLERVSKDKILTVKLPIHFLNETTAKSVKVGGGVVSHHLTDIEVNCLPANLPEYIEVDLADLELEQTLHLSDLKLPEGVESAALSHEDDKAVVSINIPKAPSAEDLDSTAAPAASEVPASTAKAPKKDA